MIVKDTGRRNPSRTNIPAEAAAAGDIRKASAYLRLKAVHAGEEAKSEPDRHSFINKK
jgi:hypothetical protein